MAGRTVGRYRVLSRVAGGGMGVVYEAIDERLGRTVALKFLHPRFASDDTAAERFRAEARTVAALEHPNVCTVHEIGETDDGHLYLAMPRYAGETLQQRIARGPLPIAEAVTIAAQIARGLAKAHDRGIVHRDVKPSNVFITDDGVVKILDFGIAKLLDGTATAPTAPRGTVGYMSPEQLRAERVDPRTDLWSLGVVLYEMLTGTRPFDAGDPAATMARIEHGEPAAPSARRRDVPAALDAVVRRALARPREARHPSAAAFERDLLALGLTTGGAGAVAAETAWRRWRGRRAVPGIALAIGVVSLVALGLAAGRRRDARDARPAAVDAPVRTAAPADGPTRSIVVLPFVNMTSRDSNEFLSDGLTEEVITRLAAVRDLKVISRTSAMHYKHSTASLRQIAGELRVAHVLEGSVRQSGGRLRITVQLIDAATDAHRWAASFDVEPRDPFRVEEEIARQVVREMEVTLGETGTRQLARRGTLDQEAYELYRRGRFHWQRRTAEDHVAAVAYFERAIARDSSYAEPWAGLADTHLTAYQLGLSGLPDTVARALHRRAAERALALDAQSSDAHTSYAVSLWWRRDWPGADRELRRALELNPGATTARNWYTLLLVGYGRIAEARRVSQEALDLDPFAGINQTNHAWACAMAHEFACAAEGYQRGAELIPGWGQAYDWIGMLAALTGRHDEAVRAIGTAMRVEPRTRYDADLAYVQARAGRTTEARRLLHALPPDRRVPIRMARAYAALGEVDSAFAWLDRTDWTWPHRAVLADPTLDPLRADPRFAALSDRVAHQMGLR